MDKNKNPERILTAIEYSISKINWLGRLVDAVADRLMPQAVAAASACPDGHSSQGPGAFCHNGICEWLHGMCQRPVIYKLRRTYTWRDPCEFPCPVNPGDPAYVIMQACAGPCMA